MTLHITVTNRKGFALPMTLLVIVALTAALAAGFVGISAEYTTNAAARGTTRAYNLAQTGLQQFLVRRSETGWCQNCSDPVTADSEWTRVALPGGYADVVAMKVRPQTTTGDAVYFIRSRGVDTSTVLNSVAKNTSAERTVGVYAKWNTQTMKVQAAWLSLSGLTKNGTGEISGIDHCDTVPGHPLPPVAGVVVAKGDFVLKGGSFNPEGNPPVDTSSNVDDLAAQVGIDWAGIQAGSIPADITVPPQNFPSWSTFQADPNYWPVIRVTQDYSLPNRGRGIIIADKNFVISGSDMWDGIILVGGQLTSNGKNTVSGATLSGLNYLTGGHPPTSSVDDDATANGNKNYVYNSCDVEKAASRLMRYVVMPNTWLDNLATW